MASDTEFVTKIPDLGAPASKIMSSEIDLAAQSYNDVVAYLLRQLRQAGVSADGKVYAVYLLGQWRAAAAVSTLIENISMTAPQSDPRLGIARWGTYPAQEALSRIGSPAVNMIVEKLPTEQGQLRRKLMCSVIYDVEGKTTGQLILQSKIADEGPGTRKINLQEALNILNSL